MSYIPDIIGTLGVIIGIGAYFLLTCEKMRADQMAYPVANLIAASLIALSLLWHWNFAAFMLELAWMAISIGGIVKLLRKSWKSTQ